MDLRAHKPRSRSPFGSEEWQIGQDCAHRLGDGHAGGDLDADRSGDVDVDQ